MKKIIFLILILFSTTYCSSQIEQNVDGKWYMINKSGFVEWTITKDSLINRKLYPNFIRKGKGKFDYGITEKIKLADRVLLVGENPKNHSEFYTIMTLVPSENHKSLKYVWNGIDSISNIKTITRLNQNDKRQLFGYDLYSKEYLETFKEKKSIDEMPLSDFKEYLKIYYRNSKISTEEYMKNIKGYYGEASSFNYQIIVSSLLELNYNPIRTSDSINLLFQKFMENDEIKEYLKELKEE
ncbi:hypothetical protein [Cellulophaga baltica]|uniref:hypothetical protein n=1 Tax=Cellulophaga baltica TaxID=76594 RepID=UPI0015F5359A|nr:hypothetical protein [Cellulophaga baltica]MBA6316904.1 hypothetical protein [Cellulophaga baltica]